jgi:heat shock protein HslJ
MRLPIASRFPSLVLGALISTTALSSCILVVEENDFGRRNGLYGTTWYLEFLVVGGHSHRTSDRSYGLSFRTESELSGTAGCASFNADYNAADSRLKISRFRTSTFGCESDDVQTLFLEYLPAVSEFNLNGDNLEVVTGGDARMVFTR